MNVYKKGLENVNMQIKREEKMRDTKRENEAVKWKIPCKWQCRNKKLKTMHQTL